MEENELAWTGERLVTSIFNYGAIDHLHRYALASQLVKGKDTLDIASGEGYGSFLLSKEARSVVGVDISTAAIDHSARKYINGNLTFKTGSADNIPLEDTTIDVVVSFETIEHHDRHDKMLTEVKRVLKPGGILIISSPDRLNYSEIPGITNEFHIKELYRHEFKLLLSKFFQETIFLNQKNIYGSLIVPEENATSYNEFSGDYKTILCNNEVQSPVYNLCIASDLPIEFKTISFFCGKMSSDFPDANEISYLHSQLDSIKKSRSYRMALLLKSFSKPFGRKIKK